METPCPVCSSSSRFFIETRIASYRRCTSCGSVFMDPSSWLSPEEDARRYSLHQNDPSDARYREFVLPLVEAIAGEVPSGACGLDYGSGSGSAVSAMLEESGYGMTRYDPNVPGLNELPKGEFDFVACCEVAEHFREPRTEFLAMCKSVRRGGILAVMTQPFSEAVDFERWRYAKDETHKVFYTLEGLARLGVGAGLSLERADIRVFLFR